MKKLAIVLSVVLLFASIANGVCAAKQKRVLVFSLTKGYHHSSIKEGITAIIKLGQENGFEADTTTDPEKFTYQNLKKYSSIIFLSPTGEFFNESQRAAFQKYIHKGGGFVGVHAATDCLYQWPWYGKLVGAYFVKHPKNQTASLTVTDNKHLSTSGLVLPWAHLDEWYNFKSVDPDIKVLVTVDEKSYTGGEMGGYHPISWYREFEGGRSFYTALGHTAECYTSDAAFLKHLLGGIQYAMGKKK